MSTTREDLDSFHKFAAQRLAAGDSAVSLDDLFTEWNDARLRDEISEAIRRGLADVDAGRHQPADAAMETIRQKFGFAKE
jgi:hypothetical protein